MATQDDGLFLLEVLIDKIVYSKTPCFSDKGFRTCVSIQCPACDPLVICDDDPGTNRVTANDSPFMKSFNNGKSCLFSLKQSDITTAMSKFPIKVSVYKELPCGCLPSKINLGEATIDMTKEFVQARKAFLEDPSNVSYEAMKDSFHLMGSDGVEAGEILMFLRISCFGKWIVTRFQGGGAPPMIGSGMGGSESVDRSCNPPRAFQSRDDPCACGASRGGGGGGAGGSHGGAGGACEPARDPYNSKPCEDPDDPCYCSGPKAAPKQDMACRNTQQYCLHVPKGRTKQFEEIGTNLCGNELKIKVPASASIIKKISQTHCAMQRPFVPDKGEDKKDPCNPPCGKNQISLALPSEDVCCHGAQLANTQFTCTTEGCPMASKHNVPAPAPPRTGTGDITANKDVFVLKVAKTAVQGDKKCKLEMELVTPKGGDKVPPVQKRNSSAPYMGHDELSPQVRAPYMGHYSRPGAPLTTTLHQGSSEDQMSLDLPDWQDPLDLVENYYITRYKYKKPEIMSAYTSAIKLDPYITTASTTRKMRHSVSFIDSYIATKFDERNCYSTNILNANGSEYGKNKTLVYMTLYDQFCRHRTSGTQATASLNKSFQASPEHHIQYQPSLLAMSSECCSTCSTSTTADYTTNKCYDPRGLLCSEMYFFSKKRDRNVKQDIKENDELVQVHRPSKSVQAQSGKTSTSVQTAKRPASSSLGTATSKAVSIKEPDKGSSLAACGNTNNVPAPPLTATVSHIRIAPPSFCAVYGPNPCQGPNCVLMGLGSDAPSNGTTPNSSSEQKVPVKVTTANNPRRGVFELVIRRLGGAPLATNELMLEWIPPPARPPCNVPCPLVCPSPVRPCRPVKCRPVYRASKPRCCKKPLRCKLPCGPKLSRCAPCDLCGRVSCPGQYPCSPCIPRSCSKPCLTPCPRPCSRPCKPRKSCKPCKPCHPPFPFKPTGCTVCCASVEPCAKPCNPPPCKPPKRPCKPCRRCKPPPRRPCRPCFPYRPCVPDLACPLSKTSIVFCPSKPNVCKPCDSCCSPFPSCFSCYTCIPLSPCTPCTPCPPNPACTPCPTYTPCPSFPSLPCNIRSHCIPDLPTCKNPCNPFDCCFVSTCKPCKRCKPRCFKPYKICRASRRPCGRCKRCRSCRPKPCKRCKPCKPCNPCQPCKPYKPCKPCKSEPPPECCEEEIPCSLPAEPCPMNPSCSTDTSTCLASCSTPCVRSCK